ncbi:MAG: redox-sensing transcriptional repressor Rex [Candidatus Cloacimonadota bacterium]|nr:MAG: redox-sensing transcriptional repressor Rex [Candidatus Cloacimonadota bacterium]PIE77973.1 MAG: redox-sensing transcriptional repressor Rex [Candidatus Delongbacteria bacterium]
MDLINKKIVERLSLYRRLLKKELEKGVKYFYSHELAKMAHLTPVQIRRDLMNIGYTGNNRKGYETEKIIEFISITLDAETPQALAIVGVGRLGTALLKYFKGKNSKINIEALFDIDKEIVGKEIDGVKCYHVDEINNIIKGKDIKIAILATSPSSANDLADSLISAGVKSIVNFTPVPLNVGDDIFLEQIDISISVEKAAYFAKGRNG